ncbi:hypothetical protein 23F_00036 [Ralstonia phage Gerry]|uniref:Uncharacterized protein n=1 Tax=Ralstonia phage Gerry TaxID=2759727 RepID=A0A7G5BA75_9CAUD|nr:hypothetical protein KMC47_gp36 [Ralstonia phage Gerry]QMV33198.1 hypothetical protein 23F_00036 [Ralstonia phage Gerry]
MNTAFLLMAQYGGKAVIPLDDLRREGVSHLFETGLDIPQVTALVALHCAI